MSEDNRESFDLVVRFRIAKEDFEDYKKPKQHAFDALWTLVDNWDPLIDAELVRLKEKKR